MAHTVDKTIYVGEGNTLVWDGLSDENKPHDDATRWINNAAISAVMKDQAGVEIIGGITLAYVPSSDGVYRGTIAKAKAALLTEGTKYFVEITAVAAGFEDGFRRFEVRARYHGVQ